MAPNTKRWRERGDMSSKGVLRDAIAIVITLSSHNTNQKYVASEISCHCTSGCFHLHRNVMYGCRLGIWNSVNKFNGLPFVIPSFVTHE